MASIRDEDEAAIRRVAILLCAGQPTPGNIAQTLEAEIREVIGHTPTTGGHGSKNWVAALESLGEIITVIAKREKAKLRAMNL